MINDKTVAELLLDVFGGNPYHAKASETNGDIWYNPVDNPLSIDDIQCHIDGKCALGSYQLLQGSDVVKWLGFDVDSKDIMIAREIVLKLEKHLSGIPHCVEFSGGKGYHVLIFLQSPLPAAKAKKILDWVRDAEGFGSTGDSHVECFPKQTQLTKARPKGNLLKIPLGKHPRTHNQSRFVDGMNGWENGPDLNPIDILSNRADSGDVLGILNEAPSVDTQLVQLLAQYWEPGKRHDMSLFLSGFLAHESWGVDQAKTLMKAICQAVGDSEEYNRVETVETTFIKHKEGKSIRGRQGLGEMLPVSVMQRLTELVSQMRAPDTVAQIDDIRYTKTRPPLENARLSSTTMWSILNDEGCRIFQTGDGIAFWYNSVDHTVTEESSESWKAMLNKQFGMNPQDSFSKLVVNELRLRIVREAPVVPIQNRTFWNEAEGKLYLNLGGPEVYILDGRTIEKSYNGECGFMFVTNVNNKFVVPDFDSPPVDAWDFLVNDLSFTTSNDAPSKPEEQRELLKAWLLAFFFQELMPTKPILAMLGQPGSGKTTAIRRILRILEDPESDVLGVPTDKQDAFRASIASHRLLVLDNLEKSGSYWMVDMLNKLATGNNIEIRELYKTNSRHMIIPRCFVACTAVSMPFSDETLFSRLLVLEMQQLFEPIAEHIMQKKIRDNGAVVWADLMRKLNDIVVNIKKNQNPRAPTKSRLVDFTVFCARISSSPVVHGDKLGLGLLSMVDSQLRQLKESSQAITFIEEWISSRPSEAEEWHTYQELYNILQVMCSSRRIDFKWKNSVGLGRHLDTLKPRLEADFGAEITSVSDQSSFKDITKIRFKTKV